MTLVATVQAVSRNQLPRPPLRAPISLTPAALAQVLLLHRQRLQSLNRSLKPPTTTSSLNQLTQPLTNPVKDYLKVAVKTKGCSGNAYTMDWVSKKEKMDEEVSLEKDLSLLIDAKALFSLLGSQMDYTDDKLSQGFLFRNPNVKETCGCGLSFTVS